mgnify:CR=1 FL=1
MTSNDTAAEAANDEDGSLTRIDVEDLTEYERRDWIPTLPYVVIGYDSSYSDKPVSTKRLVDLRSTKGVARRGGVRGSLVGDEADGDRTIGLSASTVYTSSASGRIGSAKWIAVPETPPAKTRYTVVFRSLAGNWSAPGEYDDPEYVDELTESTVDKYSYDGLRMPPEDKRRIEDVPTQPTHDGEDVRTRTKTVVDVPVTLTVADADTTDVDEVVERARANFGSNTSSWYSTIEYRDNLPEVDSEENEGATTGPRDTGRTQYVRTNTRYMVEEVEVDTETIEY